MEQQIDQKPQSPKAKLPRWFLFLIFGLVIGALLGTASYATLQYLRSKVNTNFPTHTAEDELQGWKTYRNEKYGFEVKYPVGWLPETWEESDNGIGLLHPDTYKEMIAEDNKELIHVPADIVISIMDDRNAQHIIIQNKYEGKYEHGVITVDGESATYYKVNDPDGDSEEIFLDLINDKTIHFSNRNNFNKNVFNQILSTFKFLEPVTGDNEEISRDIPSLFPKFYWTKVNTGSDPSLISVYYDNYKYEPLVENRFQNNFTLDGTEWSALIQNLTIQEVDSYTKEFDEFYSDWSVSNDWYWKQDFDDFQITVKATAADGPRGSLWGYIKKSGDYFQLLSLAYNFKGNIVEYPVETMSGIECPCDLKVHIFISDMTDIKSLEP